MLAVPYSRVSTETQVTGRGLVRQKADIESYCSQRGWDLYDGPAYSDPGVSSFGGANIRDGALGRFIADVKAGRLGSEPVALLLEDLDRFSRQHPLAVLPVLIDDILGAGITISQMQRGRDISSVSIRQNAMELHELLLSLGSAHEFSSRLSARVSDVHDATREAIRKGKPVKPDSAPAWLSLVDGQWVINEYGDTIRLVLDLISKGHGCFRIAQQLNSDGVPSPGQIRRNRWNERDTKHTSRRTKPYKPVAWSSGSIRQLLRMPQLTGSRPVQKPGHKAELRLWSEECARLLRQGVAEDKLPPRPKRQFLAPEPNYYPALISEADLAVIHQAMAARRTVEKGRIEQVRWIGQRHTFCHHCGGVVNGRVSNRKGYTDRYIGCKGLPGKPCKSGYLFLPAAQAHLLTRLSGDALATLVESGQNTQQASTLAAAMAEIASCQMTLNQVDATLAAGHGALAVETDPAVLGVLARRQAEQEAKRSAALKALATAQQAAANLQQLTPAGALCDDVRAQIKELMGAFAADNDQPQDRYRVNRLIARLGLRITVDFKGKRIGLSVGEDSKPQWQPLAPIARSAALAAGEVEPHVAVDVADHFTVVTKAGEILGTNISPETPEQIEQFRAGAKQTINDLLPANHQFSDADIEDLVDEVLAQQR